MYTLIKTDIIYSISDRQYVIYVLLPKRLKCFAN